MTLKLNQTVGELVVERPGRSRIFESFGIDYCCGGRKSLVEACAAKGIDPQTVIGILDAFDDRPADRQERSWSKVSFWELVDHIEHTHHQYLKRELPRLAFLVTKVARSHGEGHPHLVELQKVFETFKTGVELHIAKEEKILFPLVRQLSVAHELPHFPCGQIANPIRVIIAEHDEAGDAMKKMRDLTNGYLPPDDACGRYRAMLEGLKELERDMHEHVHKENSILFPAVVAAEDRLRALHGWPVGASIQTAQNGRGGQSDSEIVL